MRVKNHSRESGEQGIFLWVSLLGVTSKLHILSWWQI